MYYPDRLRKLKLPTLAYRRIRGDTIEIWATVKLGDTLAFLVKPCCSC